MTDTRAGYDIEYVAFPDDYIEEVDGDIVIPEFEQLRERGFDGEEHDYMAVVYQEPKDANTKKYDVNDHIVVAGCHAETDGKKMICKKKELFMVLHPLDEWEKYHKVKIK